jgi:hypothetical protein
MAEFYPTCSRCGKKSEVPMDGHPMACLICPECAGNAEAVAKAAARRDPAVLRQEIDALKRRFEQLDAMEEFLDTFEKRLDALEQEVDFLKRTTG